MDNWYNMDKEAVLKEQNSDVQKDLTASEAQARFGLNKFAEKRKRAYFLK
jgi:hypothetical protein